MKIKVRLWRHSFCAIKSVLLSKIIETDDNFLKYSNYFGNLSINTITNMLVVCETIGFILSTKISEEPFF